MSHDQIRAKSRRPCRSATHSESTIVFSVSRMPRSFSVTMLRRIQKQGYKKVIRKKMG